MQINQTCEVGRELLQRFSWKVEKSTHPQQRQQKWTKNSNSPIISISNSQECYKLAHTYKKTQKHKVDMNSILINHFNKCDSILHQYRCLWKTNLFSICFESKSLRNLSSTQGFESLWISHQIYIHLRLIAWTCSKPHVLVIDINLYHKLNIIINLITYVRNLTSISYRWVSARKTWLHY